MTGIHRVDWYGCYNGSWQSAPLVAEAYAHPAKVPFALAERIYRHMIDNNWLSAGDRVVDPFGGIAGCGFHAMLYGMHWTGVELESRFADLANGYDCNESHLCPACAPLRAEINAGRAKADALTALLESGVMPESKPDPTEERAAIPAHPLTEAETESIVGEIAGVLQRLRDLEEGNYIPCGRRQAGNLEIWRARYAPHFPGYGTGRLLQGDSRQLRQVIWEADGVVSSLPWQDANAQQGGKQRNGGLDLSQPGDYYGNTPGNLGNMPAGDHYAAVVSSPPYAETRIDGNGDEGASGLRAADGSYLRGPDGWERRKAMGARYGQATGNLGNLPAGDIDAVVSSPPYSASEVASRAPSGADVDARKDKRANDDWSGYGATDGQLAAMPAGKPADGIVSSPPYQTGGHHDGVFDTWGGEISQGNSGCAVWAQKDGGYGEHPDQLTGQADTFWSAARTIVEECYAILKPGGYAAWITGDYVRNKQRVPFGEQWLALCESVGFEPVLWAVAWKAESHGHQLDIFGNSVEHKTSKVSFFRRLANRNNPDAAIENEDVIFVRKPQ